MMNRQARVEVSLRSVERWSRERQSFLFTHFSRVWNPYTFFVDLAFRAVVRVFLWLLSCFEQHGCTNRWQTVFFLDQVPSPDRSGFRLEFRDSGFVQQGRSGLSMFFLGSRTTHKCLHILKVEL